ncbi:unnamed protein product, partial [Discosporangium mesarthrocarpum]
GGSDSRSSQCSTSTVDLSTIMDATLPVGRCVGVSLPEDLTPEVMEVAGMELLPEELSFCECLPKTSQIGFIGGRVAIRRALKQDSGRVGAILRNPAGAPLLPVDIKASISHKRNLAVAIVQTNCVGEIGVDIERPAVHRHPNLQRRVLTEPERSGLGSVPGLPWEEEVLLRFSFKEAFFKAAHPILARRIGFKEARV